MNDNKEKEELTTSKVLMQIGAHYLCNGCDGCGFSEIADVCDTRPINCIYMALSFYFEHLEEKEEDEMTREEKYKNVAMDLLKALLDSEETVISEYSGDFKKSAILLKKRIMEYLVRLDEDESTFNELVKDMWIFDCIESEE